MAGFSTVLSARGLVTSANNLGATEQGALVEADNVVIRFADIIEPRRGQERIDELENYPGVYPGGDYLRQIMPFVDSQVINTQGGKLANLADLGTPYADEWFPADGVSRMKSTVAGQNLHMATQKGVYVLESLTSQPRASGLPVPPDPEVRIVTATVGFLADTYRCGYRVLYGRKDIHGTKNYYLGPPSYPVVATNTTGSQANVQLTIRTDILPTSITDPTKFADGLFVQIYRTVQVAPGIPSVGDNYLQVFEQPLGGADFVSTISITDSTPDAFIEIGSTGDALPLYTNSDSEGPTQRNDPPPYSRDVATWQSRTWYAQTTNLHSLSIKLLGVGGGGTDAEGVTGVRAGDILTIAGISFTGTSSSIITPQTFRVYTGGTSAENILATARSLVNAVNDYAVANPSFTVNAFLTTGEAVPPTILLERDTYLNNTVFSVTFQTPIKTATVTGVSGAHVITTTTAHNLIEGDVVRIYKNGPNPYIPQYITVQAPVTSNSFRSDSTYTYLNDFDRLYRYYGETAWNPALPRQGTAVSSDNDDAPNRLCFSKIQEPESVPRYVNSLDIGTPGKKILRIQPMRDQMLVFKEEGTYVVYADEPYSVALLDNTVQIQAIDTVAAVGSTVFALVDDGVAAITESSIQPTSVVIQNQLMPYLGSLGRDSTADAFGIAHESDQLFSLWIPAIPGEASCPAKTFVYGLRGNAWTTWSFGSYRSCGRVDPFSDTLHMGSLNGAVFQERHSSRRSDYVDEDADPITTTVTWATHVFGQPAATKQAREMHMHFKQADFETGTLTFKVDKNTIPASGPTPVSPGSVYTTDKFIGPWEQPQQYRVLIPQDAQRGAYFTFTWSTNEAKAYWALNGFSVVYENTSERTNTTR